MIFKTPRQLIIAVTVLIIFGYFVVIPIISRVHAQEIVFTPVNSASTLGSGLSNSGEQTYQVYECGVSGIPATSTITQLRVRVNNTNAGNDMLIRYGPIDGSSATITAQYDLGGVGTSYRNVDTTYITSGEDDFGECVTDMIVVFEYEPSNTGSITIHGDNVDSYPYSACLGSFCNAFGMVDMYVQFYGIDPIVITATGTSAFDALADTASSTLFESVVGFPVGSTTELTENIFLTYVVTPFAFFDGYFPTVTSYILIALVIGLAFSAFQFYRL